MKVLALIVVIAAFCGCIQEGYSQAQQQPYRPPPTQPPRWRFRRQVMGGQLSSNPNGGADARVALTKAIGTPEHNVVGQVFAAGNTEAKTPVTTGGILAYNNNGFGATLAQEHIPGVRDTLSQSVKANVFSNDKHSIDANAFRSQNELANGLKFERNGAAIDYNHINGHGATLTHSTIPKFGSQLQLDGRANLWSSQDRNTRLDAIGSASRWTSGPLSGQNDFGGRFGLTHHF